MREEQVRAWMRRRGLQDSTISTQMSKMRKLDRHFGDLDELIRTGRIEQVSESLSRPETLPPELGNEGERAHLRQSLRYYREFAAAVSPTGFDRSALERLKAKFFERHPDFVSFDDSPSFAAMERDYKQAVVMEAQRLLAVMTDESDEALGAALIELLAGRAGLSCNLIDWRAQKVIDDVREAQPGLAERATGRLARAEDGAEAIIAYLDAVWPAMSEGRSSRPCAESRMFPTMLRALVAPGEVLPIRSSPTDHALRFLTGGDGFASAPLSRAAASRSLRIRP